MVPKTQLLAPIPHTLVCNAPALVADKLMAKEDHSLSIKKGKLMINGVEQTEAITAKYKTLIDALGGVDLDIKNSQK